MITIPPAQLPDGIEQKLLDGQRVRATHDLKERRGIRSMVSTCWSGAGCSSGGKPARAEIKLSGRSCRRAADGLSAPRSRQQKGRLAPIGIRIS
jgi:hypothetical protein